MLTNYGCHSHENGNDSTLEKFSYLPNCLETMTELIKTVNDIKSKLSGSNKPVGFVPTMGALHEGHVSLIKIAKDECKTVVVSNFVNKLQFGPNEDYEKYPRDLDGDLKICSDNGIDVMFAPSHEEIYPGRNDVEILEPPERLSGILCGKTRVGHFTGVATVVNRLFDIVKPNTVYLGEKDLQQLYVIRWLINEKKLPIFIRPCLTIREPNGLACSTRNRYLTDKQKEIASNIYKSLKLAKQNVKSGMFTVPKAILESLVFLSQFPELKVEYFEARDKENLTEISDRKIKDFYFLTAVRIDGVRLIDNIEV